MENSKREVKHVLLAKFKEEVTEEEIEESVKRVAKLVDLIPSLKACKWGKEMGIVNLHQGFTHIFELTFESGEGVAEYMSHPEHVEFGKFIMPKLEKSILVDFEAIKI